MCWRNEAARVETSYWTPGAVFRLNLWCITSKSYGSMPPCCHCLCTCLCVCVSTMQVVAEKMPVCYSLNVDAGACPLSLCNARTFCSGRFQQIFLSRRSLSLGKRKRQPISLINVEPSTPHRTPLIDVRHTAFATHQHTAGLGGRGEIETDDQTAVRRVDTGSSPEGEMRPA